MFYTKREFYKTQNLCPMNPKKMLTLTALSCEIKIFSHLKLWLATAIHNFKWQKFMLFVKFKSQNIYIGVSRLQAYLIFNNWLSGYRC